MTVTAGGEEGGRRPGAADPGDVRRRISARGPAFLVLAAAFLGGGSGTGCTRQASAVQVARAAVGRVEHRLVPDPEAIEDRVDDRLLYEGRIYLEETERILYGISLSVSMTTIREFIDRNRDELELLGWKVPSF